MLTLLQVIFGKKVLAVQVPNVKGMRQVPYKERRKATTITNNWTLKISCFKAFRLTTAMVTPFCVMRSPPLHSTQLISLFNGLKSSPPQHSSLSKLVNRMQHTKLSL
jgi:hypothetical protein